MESYAKPERHEMEIFPSRLAVANVVHEPNERRNDVDSDHEYADDAVKLDHRPERSNAMPASRSGS